MNIVITGGAGFLGSLLAQTLLQQDSGSIQSLMIVDRVKPNGAITEDPRVSAVVADITDPQQVATLIGPKTTHVFHLAAIVSSHAEQDFDLGIKVNLTATQLMLEQCRQVNSEIRFVFSSSLAVFGGTLPEVVTPMTATQPSSSYGTQKAIGELLVNDYGRKNLVDAISVRLPTICIRPGVPNQAASSFVSGMIREPLKGQTSNCPVDLDLGLWISSPETVIQNIIHASRLERSAIQGYRTFNLPGIRVTPRTMLAAMAEQVAPSRTDLVTIKKDKAIESIVASWPQAIDNTKELNLGFSVDTNFNAVLSRYLTTCSVVEMEDA
ncbi:D-erythronate dehydrogenase [Vibrio metschnikovii]|uniref:D-erythronate dehydrogenase n=1 Tax=Vibrio metschnikovii TaxID=28172 RepID=UPI0029E0EBC1|nr:SDR family oxidoreductase [Vibrio metschnikovii]EKO3602354.1 SDR family oxidoreductase [Vibrio metschnikovii]EKO3627667.1 SDR family oxidoreductase [Vibrio metschnikovii]EKO3763017.1 SDR family oxidoreductase [Vibrio metschnikovii]EKQ5809801.1 SDR family oxidoreductase [Vibrio metschnikovii]